MQTTAVPAHSVIDTRGTSGADGGAERVRLPIRSRAQRVAVVLVVLGRRTIRWPGPTCVRRYTDGRARRDRATIGPARAEVSRGQRRNNFYNLTSCFSFALQFIIWKLMRLEKMTSRRKTSSSIREVRKSTHVPAHTGIPAGPLRTVHSYHRLSSSLTTTPSYSPVSRKDFANER